MKSTKHVWKRCLSVLLVLCMIGAFILPNIPVQAADTDADLWVDPVNGDDANDGLTEETALKTIQTAKVKAAELSEDKDVVVILKGGTYDATETITFGKADSGKNGHTITYRSASGETAMISGGTRLSGWTLHDAEKNIYVTDIPAGTELTRQFYVNGLPQRMASTESSPTDWAVLQTGGYVSPAVSDQNTNEYLILDMGEGKIISSVVLYAGMDRAADNKAAGFPQDFTISTSTDGETWTTQVIQTAQEAPVSRTAVEFVFNPVAARYIKVDVTKLCNPTRKVADQYFLALTEIAVGLAGSEKTFDLSLIQHLNLDKNLLEGAEISIGYLSGGNLTVYQQEPGSKMLDGDKGTYAAANAQVPGWLAANGGGNTQAFVMNLSDVAIPVGGVELTMLDASNPNRCWLTDFEIQVTSDGETWTTVLSKSNYDWSKAKDVTAQFTFDPVPVTQIRVLGHMTEIASNDHHYMRIAEAAVYGTANISVGTNVTASTGAAADKLVDGKLDAYYESDKMNAGAIDADIVIDLGEVKEFGALRLFPNYVDGKAANYITAAHISVSDDGENFTRIMTLHDIAAPKGGAQLLLFSEGYKARYVKLEPALVNGDCLQLRELEIVPVKVDDADNPNVTSEKVNLKVQDFGYYDGSQMVDYAQDNKNNVVDGNLTNGTGSKGLQYHWLRGCGGGLAPAVIVNTTKADGSPSMINTIELVVREDGLCAPYHYTVDVVTSPDSDNWTTIYEVKEANWAKSNVATIKVPQIEIYKLRIYCYMLTPQDEDVPVEEWTGARWTSLDINELSVYNIFDNTNPYDLGVSTQGEDATKPIDSYKVHKIEAKNDNPENTYNANKAIDGTVAPQNEYGWLVPESYELAKYGNLEDIEIHVLNLWYHHMFKVTGGSGDGTELYGDTGTGWMPTWAANHYAFIDCVGEWYIDRDNLKMYYKADGTMDDKEAILPIAEQAVVMSDASNIIFDGISFQHTTWTLPSLIYYYDTQANHFAHDSMVHEWTTVPAGIKIEYSHDITFTNCEIANMGTMGMLLTSEGGDNTKNITIENSYIHDISGNGITVGDVYGHHGYQSWWRVDNTTIRNNYITRVGLDIFDSTAILATYTNGTVIDHNEVCYVPYSGVSTGWGWEDNSEAVDYECGNLVVSNNLIHNVMKTNRDGGNFYNLGHQTNGKLFGNYIYNSWDYGNTYENGYYLDMGSAFFEVYNNVAGANLGYWSHQWTASIRDNHWHDNFYVEGTKIRNDGTDNIMENNIGVPNGDFSQYPKAMEIINNAGLLDESVKENYRIGFAPQHDIIQSFYPGNGARYIHAEWGWDDVAVEGQVNKTSYDSINREIIITVSPTADLTKVVLSFVTKEGWTCDKESGATYDFTNPIKFTLTNEAGKEIVWNVTVKNKAVTGGELSGEDVNFGDLIADSEGSDWSKAPVRIINGMAYFNSRSGYTAKTFGNDTIYTFDMKVALSDNTEDWVAISLRNQDPFLSCLEGNTEYHINLTYQEIEVFKFDKGTRTVLYGNETGFEAVYGQIPNKFLQDGEKHSIKCGAIDTEEGVRLFMYVDGNVVFDFIDENSPLQTNGNNYFVIYPETQLMSIGKFTNKDTTPDRTVLDEAIEIFAGLNEADYTAESYAAVVTAMGQVETLLATIGGVTQEEVDQAYAILSEALSALVRTDGGSGPIVVPKPDDPSKPTEPSNPGDPSGKTGDETLLIAFALLMVLSVAGAAAIVTLKKRMAA